MKKVTVEVCVCAQCVMNGAMDIIEAVEGLGKLIDQLNLKIHPQVVTSSCIDKGGHRDIAPVVTIDGERIESANSQTVMSKILALGESESGGISD